jgi:hypothetical protein
MYNSLDGYESPIFVAVKKQCDEIIEKLENEWIMKIEEEVGFNIDKNELIKALNHDRHQYSEGYSNGYRKGYVEGKAAAFEEIKEQLGVVSPSEYQEQQFKVTYDGKTAAEWFRDDMCKHCINSSNGICLWQGPEPCLNFDQWRYIGNG